MSTITLDEFLAADPHELALRFKRKPPVVEPPKADVIPYPADSALVVAKAERTKAKEIDRAFEREKAAERERIRRAEALVNSEAYARAAERFNREQERLREDNWFDPTQPFGFRR